MQRTLQYTSPWRTDGVPAHTTLRPAGAWIVPTIFSIEHRRHHRSLPSLRRLCLVLFPRRLGLLSRFPPASLRPSSFAASILVCKGMLKARRARDNNGQRQ